MKRQNKTYRWLVAHKDFAGNDCLLWPFGRDGGGYARAYLNSSTTRLAHRMMCELTHGAPVKTTDVARHICGNGHLGCVNPKHLAWGSHRDNVADALHHGAFARGVRSGSAKLTEDGVAQIWHLSASGQSQRAIAKRIGVSHSAVQAVLERRSWTHLEPFVANR